MKNFKRFLAALLAIGMSVSLIGCQKSSDSSYDEAVDVPTAEEIERPKPIGKQ